jgi:hypothetical protein
LSGPTIVETSYAIRIPVRELWRVERDHRR